MLVVASGETERRSLPILTALLLAEGVDSIEVRVVPHGKVVPKLAEQVVRAAWYERIHVARLDKAVVLTDCDARSWADATAALAEVRARLRDLPLSVAVSAANWHLEAWFFADSAALRAHLGRALGSVDASTPDAIVNPKLHLRNILSPRAYTAAVAELIARSVDPAAVRASSPSFGQFCDSVLNGSEAALPD